MINFDFHALNSGEGSVLLAWIVVWVITLAMALGRHDLDPVTRLTWVVVIIFVPFFGVLLYAIVAPHREGTKKIDTRNSLAGTPWEKNPGYTSKSTGSET
jgi:hypothetical protein